VIGWAAAQRTALKRGSAGLAGAVIEFFGTHPVDHVDEDGPASRTVCTGRGRLGVGVRSPLGGWHYAAPAVRYSAKA
jgi:hypothetical protein